MELDFFQLKKILDDLFLYPPNFSLMLCTLGLLFCAVVTTRRLGKSLIILGPLWLFVSSLPITGYLLVSSLETWEESCVTKTNLSELGITHVVVLGNVVEAVKMRTQIPDAKLVISAAGFTEKMLDKAKALGVPEDEIILETESRDTEGQALSLHPILGTRPFVLCTWAIHCPRAVLAFKLKGLKPIALPAGRLNFDEFPLSGFQPSRNAWKMVHMGLHEYVGMLWLIVSQ